MSKWSVVLATVVSLPLLVQESRAQGQVWTLDSSSDWHSGTTEGVNIEEDRLTLGGKRAGEWTSSWHAWGRSVDAAQIEVHASVEVFINKKIDVIVDGSEVPYTDPVEVPHDWYGRCMIAIVDENR